MLRRKDCLRRMSVSGGVGELKRFMHNERKGRGTYSEFAGSPQPLNDAEVVERHGCEEEFC